MNFSWEINFDFTHREICKQKKMRGAKRETLGGGTMMKIMLGKRNFFTEARHVRACVLTLQFSLLIFFFSASLLPATSSSSNSVKLLKLHSFDVHLDDR
jgi:hypothetical protein